MKYIYSFILSVLITGVFAQELIVSDNENPQFEEEYCEQLSTKIHLTNQSSSNLNALWYLDRTNAPEEWEFQVCDIQLCYPWGTEVCPESKVNILLPGTDHPYELKVITNQIGSGSVDLVLHNALDVNDIYKVITYEVIFTPCLLSSYDEELLEDQVTLFPNPVSDVFAIATDIDYNHIIISDIMGRSIKQYQVNQEYTIGDLESGVYLVQLVAQNNQSSQTIRMFKK